MPRAPLAPLVVGARTIPLAYPSLALRIALLQTWSELTPDGEGAEAPIAIQHQLAFAAVGMAWEAAHRAATAPMEAPPATLAACGHDLLRFGAVIGDAFDSDEAVDGFTLIRRADEIAGALIATVTVRPATVKAAETLADFSEARPVEGSAPGSAPPTDGSAPRSPGTV
jgi:hypothetical protein